MKRLLFHLAPLCAAYAVLFTTSLAAQVLPVPSAENPRIQSIAWSAGQEVILTALPKTGLTVLLEPGEEIRRVSVENESHVDVRVSAEQDSLLIIPQVDDVAARMLVQTNRRNYLFSVQTAFSLSAAYLVKFTFAETGANAAYVEPEPTGKLWTYRLKGDRVVRPAQISDDGIRTRILFGAEQALPAVFAIGPSGDEEVVNGYMRDGVFVIDRVYSELVFRIDKEKATARRNREPDNAES
ncbi:TrbG/VirB9 family P-type conjugative transfer protein [Pontixanthobacter sp. CEM42]|uniref:TrbG/VirB9 family P-type conjugative transfer protein n=1 Tax=Pontixanthobacter sp. CEM42 TaxID=2792077 RepID=UPI001AE0CE16